MNIKEALEKNKFMLFYQPKVDFKSNKIVGAEALLRLIDNNEIITPDDFMPEAEESGEIVEIDKWVIKRVINDEREMFASSNDSINISFNLSALSFKSDDFIEELSEMFESTKDFNSKFEIEITENSVMDDVEKAKKTLEELKELGFTLSIDDFGVGRASLIYLKEFPIDVIKINKSFIDEITSNEKVRGIVDSLIFLAKRLNLSSIAKGVEDIEQVELLKEINCDNIQGYFYAKPLPLEKFIIFLKSFNETEIDNQFVKYSDKLKVGNSALDSHNLILVNVLNTTQL